MKADVKIDGEQHSLAAKVMLDIVIASKPTYICIQHMYASGGVLGHGHNVHHCSFSRRVLAWLLHQ